MKGKSSVKRNYPQPIHCCYWPMCETEDLEETHQFSVVRPLCMQQAQRSDEKKIFFYYFYLFINAFFSFRSKESYSAELLQAALTSNAPSYLNASLCGHVLQK